MQIQFTPLKFVNTYNNKIHTRPLITFKSSENAIDSFEFSTSGNMRTSTEFEKKRDEIIEKLKDVIIDDANLDYYLGATINSEQVLIGVLIDFCDEITRDIESCTFGGLFEKNDLYNIKSTTLALEKEIKERNNISNRKFEKLALTLTEEDTSKDVLKVKEKIKSYGVEEVYLDNDINFAKKCLKLMKLLEKNGVEPPTRIIGSKFFAGGMSFKDDEKSTIIVNSREKYYKDSSTGQTLLGVLLHEVCHSTVQPNLYAYNIQSLSESQRRVADKVSMYASDNWAYEVHAELFKKKFTKGLTKQEEKLFEDLGGMWRNSQSKPCK